MKKLVYIVPVHNEEQVLAANVERLTAHLARYTESRVLLIENGSRDASWPLAERLASKTPGTIQSFREPNAGIGYAYHRGLIEALRAAAAPEETWAVLTAADLPFGFSDLDAALASLERVKNTRIMMGSKAHPGSNVPTSATRRTMTLMYRLARRLAVGMRVGDSQGSVFLRLDLAATLVPKIQARDFFYSTELCHYAERAGEDIVELPVSLGDYEVRTSTVRPLKDGWQMARQLWQLRAQERR